MIVKTLTEQNHLILKKVKSYENLRNNSIKKKKKKAKSQQKGRQAKHVSRVTCQKLSLQIFLLLLLYITLPTLSGLC